MGKSKGSSNKSGSGFTRRDVVAATLAAPAVLALAGSNFSLAQSGSTVAVRKEISSMDSAELKVFKDALRIMKARPASDPTSWAANAAFHKAFCSAIDLESQIHFAWTFLPWHRVYLNLTERKLRAAVNEPSLALPYWDWEGATPRMPDAYTGNESNPMWDSTRWRGAGDESLPKDLANQSQILRARTFDLFHGGPLIDIRAPATPSPLESPHNIVHYWVGGNMGSFATASLDPIFFATHGNIDRQWAIWARLPSSAGNPVDPRWLERKWVLTDEKGLPIEMAIKDVVDTEAIGYRYDNVAPPADVASFVSGTGPETAGAISIEAPRDNKPNVLIDKPVIKPLTGRAQAPIIKALAAENPKIVVLNVESIVVPEELVVSYRFFLNRPDADAFTVPDPAKGYLGNISLVPLAGDGMQPRLDVRAILPEGVLNDMAAQDENSVTIVPVGITIEPLGFKAPLAPPVRSDYRKLSLSVGEPGLA